MKAEGCEGGMGNFGVTCPFKIIFNWITLNCKVINDLSFKHAEFYQKYLHRCPLPSIHVPSFPPIYFSLLLGSVIYNTVANRISRI